jgi:hypothetical protein
MSAIKCNTLTRPPLLAIAMCIRRCERDTANTAPLLRIANSLLIQKKVKVADLIKAKLIPEESC